nr:putative quinol monooxygenase [uncultured Chryseobacterium sp.]
MNLHIVALFKFNESYLMEAVDLFQKLVRETRKEEGCLQYELIEDNEKKGTFFLIELWESVEHHNRHNGTDHLFEFRQNTSRILTEIAQVYKGFKIY